MATNIFTDTITLTKGTTTAITLGTADKYVTENIVVNVKPQAGSFSNAEASGVTYSVEEGASTVIPAGGYLYINKGWYDNTKISLGHLIPDDGSYTNAGNGHILSGFEAYDTNGNKLIGTIPTITPKFDGGGLSITPTVKDLTAPGVTIDYTGKLAGDDGANYFGVKTTAIEGEEGETYLSIDATGTPNNGSVKAAASVTRAAVLYNGATVGYVDKADNTEALAAGSNSSTSNATTITPTVTDKASKLYIPIVDVIGKGGGVLKTGGSATATITKPTVTISKTGKFTDVGSGGTALNYGVTTTKPSSGADGTNFLAINIGSSVVDGAASGTATIGYSRAAVLSKALAQGLINKAADSTLLDSTTGSLEQTISGTIGADVNGTASYYIPIVTIAGQGGGVTKASSGNSMSITGTAPTVTISHTGKFTDVGSGGVGASYGVTKTAPSGTDGTNFLLIQTGGSSNTQTYTSNAEIAYSRAAVTNNADKKGAISMAKNASLLAATSGTLKHSGTKDITASVSGATSYYIPIVTIVGTGGTVSKTSGTITVSGTNPTVTITGAGSLTEDPEVYSAADHKEEYDGEGGKDGKDYVKFSWVGSSNTQTFTGSGSLNYTRAAVTNNAAKAGAIKMASGAQLLAQETGTLDMTNGTKSVSATITGTGQFTLPIIGGKFAEISQTKNALSDGSITVSCDNIPVTPKTNLLSRTGSTNGSAITDSTYAITSNAPTTGNWVVIDPDATSTAKTASASVEVSYDGEISIPKGITSGIVYQTSASESYSGTKSVSASIQAGTTKYIPVVSPSASVISHTTLNATVAYKQQSGYFINGTKQSSVPSGIVIGSQPGDFNKENYIIVQPYGQVTNGSATAKARATISAGITAGSTGTDSGTDTKQVSVTESTSNMCYIKVYKGEYSVS